MKLFKSDIFAKRLKLSLNILLTLSSSRWQWTDRPDQSSCKEKSLLFSKPTWSVYFVTYVHGRDQPRSPEGPVWGWIVTGLLLKLSKKANSFTNYLSSRPFLTFSKPAALHTSKTEESITEDGRPSSRQASSQVLSCSRERKITVYI